MRKFVAENGYTLEALDDTQADAMLNGGLTEVFDKEETIEEVVIEDDVDEEETTTEPVKKQRKKKEVEIDV